MITYENGGQTPAYFVTGHCKTSVAQLRSLPYAYPSNFPGRAPTQKQDACASRNSFAEEKLANIRPAWLLAKATC